ncbi:SDR family oxidoreductase [Deinococcus planocerae]|uniref:SDR family oxidoreductase n=1 Tax=Deinococcus planocerae TaxID=1737569 RepID=UPI000C7F325A|nr:SDR family oxidoreductase [Deinococcus planocerae]
MRVFVTGATGWIGSAVVQELLGAGHEVLGLARGDASADRLRQQGVEVQRGDLADPESLAAGARQSEGVVHTAYTHDFSDMVGAAATDLTAVRALVSALEGTGHPLIISSGMAGRTEHDAGDPGAMPRLQSEVAALAAAERGVRGVVMRYPPTVHGPGDHGLVAQLITIAQQQGVSAYIGDGQGRWPAVHRLDAARAVRLALEGGQAGARYHAVAEEGVPTREIASAIGRQLNLPVVSKSPEEAQAHFGWLGAFFGRDLPTSSTWTREGLGWQPTHPGLIADLDEGHYFQS